jgi:hypothetical protein
MKAIFCYTDFWQQSGIESVPWTLNTHIQDLVLGGSDSMYWLLCLLLLLAA